MATTPVEQRWKRLALIFVLTYLTCWSVNFLRPVFWNAEQRMIVPDRPLTFGNPPRQVPGAPPGPATGDGAAPLTGVDIRWVRSVLIGDLAQHPNWFMRLLAAHPAPLQPAPVPRLYVGLFTLLPEETAYRLSNVLAVASLVWLLLAAVPWLFPEAAAFPAGLVLLITALGSYGLQWELERGQFDLVAMAMTFAGLGWFHRARGTPGCLWGLAVLSFAAQLKVWPACFFLCAFSNPRDARGSVNTAAHLLWINTALALSQGWGVLERTVDYVIAMGKLFDKTQPVGNIFDHSIVSFARLTGTSTLPYQVAVGVCFLVFLVHAFRRGSFWNPESVLMAGMASYVALGMSYEYKLSCLPILALVYGCAFVRGRGGRLAGLSAILVGLGYCQTLHPTVTRDYLGPVSGSAFPCLLAMLVGATLLLVDRAGDAPITEPTA